MNFNLLVIKLRISSTCYTAALKTCYVKKITCSPMSGFLCNAIITPPHAVISTENRNAEKSWKRYYYYKKNNFEYYKTE